MAIRSWLTGRRAVASAAWVQAIYFVLLAVVTLVLVRPRSAAGTAVEDVVFAIAVALVAWFAGRGSRWPLILLAVYEPLNAVSDVASFAGAVHPSTPTLAIAIDLVVTIGVLAIVIGELVPRWRPSQPLPKTNS